MKKIFPVCAVLLSLSAPGSPRATLRLRYLAAAVEAGTIAGLFEGIACLYRQPYAGRYQWFCLLAPVVLTAATFVLAALVLLAIHTILRLRRLCLADLLTAISAAYLLVGALALVVDLAAAVRAADGGLSALVATGIAITLIWVALLVPLRLVAALLLRARPWTAWFAYGAASLNLVALVSVASTVQREGRELAYSIPGPPRLPNEQNLLLITIDTLRADRVLPWGGNGHTPHLDEFAQQADVYLRMYAPAPWTLPSLASLLTGLSPFDHGAGASTSPFDLLARTPVRSEVRTIAQRLQECGYRTQAFVTNPFLSAAYGLDRGFRGYENLSLESEAFLVLRDVTLIRTLLWTGVPLVVSDIGETVRSRAVAWLRRHGHEKFFLWLHFLDPHAPYGAPEQLGHKSFRQESLLSFRPPSTQLETRFDAMARVRAGEIRLNHHQRTLVKRLYDRGVRYADRQLGIVLEELRRLGLAHSTVTVITSDHGEELWERGSLGHGHSLHMEVLHVPALVRWPGQVGQRRIDERMDLSHLMGPVLARLGCVARNDPDDTGLDHRFHRDVLRAGHVLLGQEQTSLMFGHFKFIGKEDGSEELYNVLVDPEERRNLAAVTPELVRLARSILSGSGRGGPESRQVAAGPFAP